MMTGYNTIHHVSWLLLLFFVTSHAHGDILDVTYVPHADIPALQAEISVFSTIQQGVILSVSECELSEDCDASVSKYEIEQLIDAIEERVTALSTRYLDSANEDLEGVLLAYAETRDRYQEILDKLQELPQFHEEEEKDTLSLTGGVPPAIFELFYDADEELMDDFIVEEFNDE